MNLIILASEGGVKNPTLWYPTILGLLVVVAGIVLFCGSIYLLLATNLGARLGFLVAAAALSGFMVLLSAMWLATASPLNTLKGRVPSWKPVEAVKGNSLAKAKTVPVRDIFTEGRKLGPTDATNVKAEADQVLVVPQAEGGEKAAPPGPFAQFQGTTEYLQVDAFETGGGGRFSAGLDGSFPFLHLSFHEPKYAVSVICPVKQVEVPFGEAPPAPACDPTKPRTNLVMIRDLGSVRVPPLVVLIASSILFGLTLLSLHWRELDLRELAAESSPVPAERPSRAPAQV